MLRQCVKVSPCRVWQRDKVCSNGLRVVWHRLSLPRLNVQGPSVLVSSKRAMPTTADIKYGPAGVPYVGKEAIRVDKGLSQKLGHTAETEILRDGLEVTHVIPCTTSSMQHSSSSIFQIAARNTRLKLTNHNTCRPLCCMN